MHRPRSDLICHLIQDDLRTVTIHHCQQHALIAAIDARLFIAATFLLKTVLLFITAASLNFGDSSLFQLQRRNELVRVRYH